MSAALIGFVLGAALALGAALLIARKNRAGGRPAQDRESQFRAIVDHDPDALVIVDEGKRITRSNPRLLELFGYASEQELLGKPINFLIPERFHAAMDSVDTHTIRHGTRLGTGIGLWVLRKDGSEFPVDVIAAPIDTDEGHFISVTLRDVTDQYEQQRALEQSEAQFRSLLEAAPDAILVVDGDRVIRQVNPRVEEMFGYSRDQLVDQPVFMLIPERLQEAFFAGPARDLEPGASSQGISLFGLRSDGSEFPLEVNRGVFRSADGVLIFAIVRDVTERNATEEALRQSEARFRRIVEGLKDEYVFFSRPFDPERPEYFPLLAYVSPSIENVLGFTPEEFIEISNEFRDDANNQHMDHIVAEQRAGRAVPPYEAEFRHKNGEMRLMEVLDSPVFDELGRVVAVEGIARDVTLQRRAAAQLEEAREAAEAANRAKSAFLANMSHELRTPMNAILGYSEMLIEDAEDDGHEALVPDLKKIHQSGAHLLALINDVLDLAKIESGKMEALSEDFEVDRLIDEVSATAQPLMGSNDNQLRIEREGGLGSAHQDLTKLRQSLLNLLSNAAKFTREGTVTLNAERSVRDGADWLTFAIGDSGIGIPADKLGRIFEEFGQADETTSRDYGGTGLGLPISRRFCRMLGGDLEVESHVGQGSTFTIQVPAALPGAAAKVRADAEATRTEVELAAIRRTGPGRTVLVIDDDAEARDLVERLLRRDDFTVVTAATGEAGLRLAHELRPAVITLDVMMPDMDGWAVLRALKADPVLRDVPVVMLTMLDDKTRGYSLGATDYLVKPVDRDALRRVVSRYSGPSTPGRALLIDDDPAVRETVSHALSATGWEVLEAENGQVALDQMATSRPTLILLDLMMPVMDGFDFLVELHANPDWRDIPVVVLTAKDLTAEDRRVLSGRVEQIFEKGAWSHEQLVDLVHKLAQ